METRNIYFKVAEGRISEHESGEDCFCNPKVQTLRTPSGNKEKVVKHRPWPCRFG